jgi:hypothetical protein
MKFSDFLAEDENNKFSQKTVTNCNSMLQKCIENLPTNIQVGLN